MKAAESEARNVRDRKSTRLNSSHVRISYAVLCLKKKINFVDYVNYTFTSVSSYYLLANPLHATNDTLNAIIPTAPAGSQVHFCFIEAATTEIYTLSLHDALPI